ncbi:MAG: hypothetical protein NXI31_24380 [bacterium]|nr:hypothetical protein [bacterium]
MAAALQSLAARVVALALGSAIATAAAQSPAQPPAGEGGVVAPPRRQPTFVRVLDPDRAPVANATVTFAGGHGVFGERLSPADVQTVAADARGRARARLLPGLCYVVWAVTPADENGQQLVAEPEQFFGAGSLLELRCRRVLQLRRALPGEAAWGPAESLRAVLLPPRPGGEIELTRDDAGRWLRPPFSAARFELRNAAGEPLWSATSLDKGVPPPCEVRVVVRDPDGQPIAGAVIRHRVAQRPSWAIGGLRELSLERLRRVGVTDAKGEATVVVPYRGDPTKAPAGWLMLHVEAPGHARIASGTNGRHFFVNDRRVESVGERFEFVLPPVEPVYSAAGVVPPGTVGQLTATCKLRTRGNSYIHDVRTFVATADAAGRLSFDNVPDDVHSVRLAVLLPGQPEPVCFCASTGRVLPPALRVPVVPPEGRYGTVALRVIDASGGPARGEVATVVTADASGLLQRRSTARFGLDSRGRGRLGLEAGKWIAVVLSREGYGAKAFDVGAGIRDLELRLEPLANMKLVLRDQQGDPVAGARVRVEGSRTVHSVDQTDSALRQFALDMKGRWSALQTDAEGRLELPFLPIDSLTWRVRLTWPGGKTAEFPVEAREQALVLRPV